MNPLLHIRRDIFSLTQAEMADMAGVRQATVSRWERGLMSPTLKRLSRIRREAQRRKLPWDDNWLFMQDRPA